MTHKHIPLAPAPDPDAVTKQALKEDTQRTNAPLDAEQTAVSKRQQRLAEESEIRQEPLDQRGTDPILSLTSDEHTAAAEKAVQRMVQQQHQENAAGRHASSGTWKDYKIGPRGADK
jgi:hypothetical protein